MTSDAILAELRTLPGAPDGLRERVRALPEPQPRFVWSFPRIDVRRSLLVLTPAVVAVAVGAAALHGVLAGGPQMPQPVALRAETHSAQAGAGGATAAHGQYTFGAHTTQDKVLAPQALLQVRGAKALPPSTTFAPSSDGAGASAPWRSPKDASRRRISAFHPGSSARSRR